ncbi:restriction endonuclease subunit S [Flavonifractor sp. An306]|uniref:restriction endonuclease subunit S n=1 Tax=Flavonifractor sp. An306 TaxID=1965629 RepID=UPI00174AC70F|nr:restriction endonuclease subunit S [Flavonifractor sp. An306]
MARLGDVCTKGTSNIAQKDLEGHGGNYPIYGASGFIANVDFYQQENPYIAVVKDGAGIGRIMKLPAKSSIIGTMQYIIPNDTVDISYLAYAMEHMNLSKYFTGATIPHIYFKDYQKEELPLPSLDEQRKIAAVLDKVSDLIVKRRQQLDKLDEMVKARFVEMFGDTIYNPYNWPTQQLEEMADIVSGITKGRKTKDQDLIEVPYMAVSNVKDGYIDWTTVKTILATQSEVEQYHLLPDDILMTEGGDPDKLGRGAIIQTPPENCIHQNHIFRVRLNEKLLLPCYFAEFLKHQKAKQYFLRCAKQTTGIASINMRQLKGLPTLVPPLELQNQFTDYVAQTEKTEATINRSLEKLETLKKALMQEYFE